MTGSSARTTTPAACLVAASGGTVALGQAPGGGGDPVVRLPAAQRPVRRPPSAGQVRHRYRTTSVG